MGHKENQLKYLSNPENKIKHIERVRRNDLIKKYGITVEDYNKMFQEQDGKCAICHKDQLEFRIRFSVDHNHKTGKVRGLLCHNCNRALGWFYDDIETLQSAIEYLQGDN